MKKRILTAVLMTIGLVSAQAQGHWCATDEVHEYNMQNKAGYAEDFERMQDQVDRFIANNYSELEKSMADTLIVPLVIHVIHDNGTGNISKEQILDGIRILNEDFLRVNADTSDTREVFKPYAAGINIQFRLAKIDPNGDCTEGIIRINNPEMSNGPSPRDQVKALSHWPENKYFNVWIVNEISGAQPGSVILGYGEFPTSNLSSTYGFVNIHQAWGQIGTGVYGGRTPTHEIGHCLNLYHTFQSGCGSSCNTSGDRVCDTPPSSAATYGCSQSQNTCSNDAVGTDSPFLSNVVDQIENYMSYDGCQNMFTAGQRERVFAAINNSPALQNLMSEANLIATGTNDGYVPQNCAPIAGFDVSQDMICQGSSITVTDKSYNSDSYTRSWNFEGADVTTGSDSISTVTYGTAGTFDISLTVSNGAGSDTYTWTDAVVVNSTTPQYSGYMKEEFGTGSLPNGWSVNNYGGVGWELTQTTGVQDGECIYLNNRVNASGNIDEIVIPVFDVKGLNSPSLTFYHAYARKVSTSNDVLNVYVSTNCGQTWIRRLSLDASELATGANQPSGTYVPSSSNEWIRSSLNLAPYTSRDYLLVKLEFISGGGNNIYLDRFIIGDQAGVNGLDASLEVELMPNPTQGETRMIVFAADNQEVVAEIMDLTGRVISRQNIQLSAGQNAVALDLTQEAAGVYVVTLSNAQGKIQKKLVKH